MEPDLPSIDPYEFDTNPARIQEAISRLSVCSRPPGTEKGLSVIILNLNKPELIIPLIENLLIQKQQFTSRDLLFDIIIGDTGSTNSDVLHFYEKVSSQVLIIPDLKYHFSKNNNLLAFEHARCESLLFLNNDVVFPAGQTPLFSMYEKLLTSPGLGCLGLVMLFPDHTVQHLGVAFSKGPEMRGFCYHPRSHEKINLSKIQPFSEVPAVTGAALMIRSQLYWAARGMDERYHQECQDIALCLTVHRLGYYSQVANQGETIHLENGTRNRGEENKMDRARFMRKWKSYIEAYFL